MIWRKKIKGGALQFVLFVGTIVAVLLMCFVLISHSHKLFKQKTDVTIALIQAADNGLTYSFGQSVKNNEQVNIPEKNDLNISVTVQKKYWGLIELRSATAQKGQLKFTKISFVGRNDANRAALYLKDNQRPMVIAGNAKITGTAYLPERGIKMGNIGGYGYTKPYLIYGNQQRSSAQLPQPDQEVLQQLKLLTSPSFEPKGIAVDFKKGSVLQNSFAEESLVIKDYSIDLDGAQLTGNILVWAANKIVVRNTAQLRDVVLIAPNIEIKDGVRGNFQAFAQERIEIGRSCNLEYPSVLAAQSVKKSMNKKDRKRDPNIYIKSETSVSGTVVYWDENESDRHRSHIKIDEKAVINGEVHCAQNLELKGSVFGNVTTNAFVAMENGGVYLNHLFNGRIDATMLPSEFGGLCFDNKPANCVLKWLY